MLACRRELDPAIVYERHQQVQVVCELLTELERHVSCTNYQVIHLRWIAEYSVAEVASMLDLTPQQVSYRQYRAKAKLRRLLKAERPQHSTEP